MTVVRGGATPGGSGIAAAFRRLLIRAPERPRRAVNARTWWLAALTVVAATAGMLIVRTSLDKAHVALVYLLIVLGGSALGGRLLGVSLAALAFLLFDYLFLPPYHTLVVANPLDWLVLFAFLTTGVVAAQLLDRAQERAVAAERRAAEVARLSALGAETLNAARAEEALAAIAEVIRSTLDVDRCELYIPTRIASRDPVADAAKYASERRLGDPAVRLVRLAAALRPPAASGAGAADAPGSGDDIAASDGLVAWVAEHGRAAAERADGTSRIASRVGPARRALEAQGSGAETQEDAVAGLEAWHEAADTRALAIPLQVRGRTVGVLRLASAAGLTLHPDQRQFLSALAYYAALGIDRFRLASEAQHAAALREADRLKDAFLANVSHDLRTPLTTIKAVANAIRTSGDVRAAAIEEEADRLNRFVADLLDLSRLSGGALPLHLEFNTAEELIGATRERVRGILADRPLRIEADPAGEVLAGRFDFVHSLHVLMNLIENAQKYAPPGTPIELSVARVGTVLRFIVGDHGPGIPEAEQERIFEPFYRVPGRPPDAGARGVGLGLSIARGLAEAQGGSLRYVARPEGGSLFLFDLPAADIPLPSPATPRPLAPPPSGHPNGSAPAEPSGRPPVTHREL